MENEYPLHDAILAELAAPDAESGKYLQDYHANWADELYKIAADELIANGLIKKVGNAVFIISVTGRQVQSSGGYSSHVARIEAASLERATREIQSQVAEIKNAEASERSAAAAERSADAAEKGTRIAKWALWISIFGTAVALTALLVSLFS